MDENLDDAAARELKEETHLENVELHQFHTFGEPNRDPRQRTITVAYWGIDDSDKVAIGDDDAKETQWFATDGLPKLAFDHAIIIDNALNYSKL